jgi:hypothetical protein
MERHVLVQRVESAMQEFDASDRYLLEHDVNERTISTCLAHHLQSKFDEWNVDCEYNRVGDTPKRLQVPRDGACWDDTSARTVFPDIIVHQRGPDGPNLLVLELKKAGLDATFDLQKLKAYKTDLGYEYAAFVEVTTGAASGIKYSMIEA